MCKKKVLEIYQTALRFNEQAAYKMLVQWATFIQGCLVGCIDEQEQCAGAANNMLSVSVAV